MSTILVIDDEREIREMIREMAEAAGYRCVLARNVDEADELLGSHDVHGVTLDLHMPGRSGLEWLATLEAARPGLARRTLLVTGSRLDAGQLTQLRRTGAGLLFKPFGASQLLTELAGRVKPH